MAGESELFEVIRPGELGISPDELAVQRGIYDAAEFSTALKPHLLRHLLDRGASSVVFSDADTDVYAGLDDVAAAATTDGLALTPHVLRPIPGDGMTPTQIEYQQIESGIFNTGLLAVADGGRTFLDWWGSRLARDCLSERRSGMWVDQRWTDWVPAYFDHMVLRDTSLNVAFWNLHERPLDDVAGNRVWTARPCATSTSAASILSEPGFSPLTSRSLLGRSISPIAVPSGDSSRTTDKVSWSAATRSCAVVHIAMTPARVAGR